MSKITISVQIPCHLDSPVLIAAIFICSIGGTFQYGFSVSVMTSPSAVSEMVSLIWSFTVSIFCIGGLIGSLMSGPLTSRFGRKRCLLLNNFLAIFGAILMLLSRTAISFEMIIVGRFLYGINSAQTMYLTESAPKKLKGMVGLDSCIISKSVFPLYRELLGSEKNWPWLLSFNGFTAFLQLCTLPLLPESPRFLLLERGNLQAAEKAFRKLWGKKDYTKEVEEMLEEKAAIQGIGNCSVLELIQNRRVRWQLLTIVIAFAALQLNGISAVYFYSFDVFRAAGIKENKLAYAALGTGLCEVSTSIVCFMIIESMSRKVLLFSGYMGMAATMGVLTVTIYFQKSFWWMPYCSMVLFFLFIFFFSSGPGMCILQWEILTQSFKSAGYTVGCTINWICLFVLGALFPILVNLGNFCFLIFLAACLICGIHVRFNMPETKNRTALEISVEFDRMHSQSNPTEGIRLCGPCGQLCRSAPLRGDV
uniref:Solute carrier family 2 member 11, like n=1 Tax=Cyprinodon variegatus TaxID=28743 RepID=A0A3Q2CJG4_CYPVA